MLYFVFALLFSFIVSPAPLWPIPAQYALGAQTVWMARNVQFHYSILSPTSSPSCSNNSNHLDNTSFVVEAAIRRAQQRLFTDGFVPWRFHPRNSDFEPDASASESYISSITISQNATDPENVYKALAGTIDEAHTLSISTSGGVLITAVSSIGILRALETFTQLFYQHSQSSEVYSPYVPVDIIDAPKFSHRGLNLDVARNYYAPSDIMRTIDALSWNKFNCLHLHVTDGQSWPLEIPSLPALSEKGAYMAGLSYSPAVLAEIQEYGAYRGVQVYLETDMPGHTSVIALSYPDLIAAFNVLPDWDTYAAEPPSGSLKLNSSAVYSFLETLWNDLLPRLYPYSAYFHTGGDEVKLNAYLHDETVRSNDFSVIQPLLQKFVDFNHDKVRAAELTPIVWEEMLLEWDLSLGSDVLVQAWQSDEAVLRTVQKGHKVIAGNYHSWYLDCGHGQWLDALPSSQIQYPYEDYCAPFHNWRVVYAYDPLSGIPADLSHLVLGGEVDMWSEQTDGVNLDGNVWPRAAAAAEVLWSGAKNATGRNRSQVEASPRLAEWRERMVRRGIGAGPVQMVFCTQNGTQCAL